METCSFVFCPQTCTITAFIF